MSTGNEQSSRPVGTHFGGDLRRALMDAAIVTIRVEGVDRLSLRAVARRVGVSHAAPAHHFGDKAGLLTAIAIEGFRYLADHLAPHGAPSGIGTRPDDDPLDRLASLARSYVAFASAYPAHFEVMFRPTLVRGDDAELAAAGDVAFLVLRGQVEQAQRTGWRIDENTDALTAAAWSMAHGLSVLRAQGSLERHFADTSMAGVDSITASML